MLRFNLTHVIARYLEKKTGLDLSETVNEAVEAMADKKISAGEIVNFLGEIGLAFADKEGTLKVETIKAGQAFLDLLQQDLDQPATA